MFFFGRCLISEDSLVNPHLKGTTQPPPNPPPPRGVNHSTESTRNLKHNRHNPCAIHAQSAKSMHIPRNRHNPVVHPTPPTSTFNTS